MIHEGCSVDVKGRGSWAALVRVQNTHRRFGQVGGGEGYGYVKTTGGEDFLFTPSELARARARAAQNVEDLAGWQELLAVMRAGGAAWDGDGDEEVE